MGRMRALAIRIGCWLAGIAAAIVLLALFLLRTPPGRDMLAAIVREVSGGSVAIAGLDGSLPNHLAAAAVEVSDGKGVWLRIENLALDWDALGALRGRYRIYGVSASRVAVLRRPIREESQGTTPEIDIDRLHAPRIELAESVAGRDVILSVRGALSYRSSHRMHADLSAAQIGGAGRYRIEGGVEDDVAVGSVSVAEGADGILAALAGLPGLGPVALDARGSGSRDANRVTFRLAAGALRASGGGTLALAARRGDLDFTLRAPAMKADENLSWRSLELDGHLHGGFDAPRIDGRLSGADIFVSGIRAGALHAVARGDHGTVEIGGTATALRIPGGRPDLFASAPVELKAKMDLRAPSGPVTFSLSHPLLAAYGSVETRGPQKLAVNVTVPSLQPFAALANEPVSGRATLRIDAEQGDSETAFRASGRIEARGESVFARVLGANAEFSLGATLSGADIVRSEIAIDGAALGFRSGGTFRDGRLDYAATVNLTDVSRLSSALNGNAFLSARVQGPMESAETRIAGNASLASSGFARQRIELTAQASGFPRPSSGQVRITGALNGASVAIRGDLTRKKGGVAAVASAVWKSLRASGDFTLPEGGAAAGRGSIDVRELADLAPLLGLKIKGALSSAVTLNARGRAQSAALKVTLSNFEMPEVKAGKASIEGTIANPFAAPNLSLGAHATGIATHDASGSMTARLTGPASRLAIAAKASIGQPDAEPAGIEADGVLVPADKKFVLNRFRAVWKSQSAILGGPATVDYDGGVAVDRLILKLGGGEMRLAGRLTPALAATASAEAIQLETLRPLLPARLAGTVSANAKLGGTIADPRGTLSVRVRNLVASDYWSKPAASLDVRGTLQGGSMALDAELSAGPSASLTIAGDAPLRAGAPLRLHAAGKMDLAMVSPLVAAEGRQVRGALSLDADIGGTYAAPRARGSATVKDGDFRDYGRGVRLHAIDAALSLDGEIASVTALTARAGKGTISGTGTADFGAPGVPVEIAMKIRNARPIASDLATATMSGDIRVSGRLNGTVRVSGTLDVVRGTINIPERFPPEVAVLDVRRRGEKPPPEPSGGAVALDIALRTSGPVFVRGRGIDADMSGHLRLGGTIAAPIANGGFDMNRGTVSLAGQTLTFTSGKLGFDGAGLSNQIDPALDFVAQTTSGGVTAKLTVGGHASSPKIALSSTPQLPQDEVLAHLFFQQSAKQLSPLQLAQIAQAIASLGGLGSGFDPLGALRRSLRLDRLSVGSTGGGAPGSESQTTLEAGKYVSRNVYVGAKQSLSGSTQVQVQVDLTRHLKAQATVSTGTNATATKGNAAQDNGSSAGLSYEFEY